MFLFGHFYITYNIQINVHFNIYVARETLLRWGLPTAITKATLYSNIKHFKVHSGTKGKCAIQLVHIIINKINEFLTCINSLINERKRGWNSQQIHSYRTYTLSAVGTSITISFLTIHFIFLYIFNFYIFCEPLNAMGMYLAKNTIRCFIHQICNSIPY